MRTGTCGGIDGCAAGKNEEREEGRQAGRQGMREACSRGFGFVAAGACFKQGVIIAFGAMHAVLDKQSLSQSPCGLLTQVRVCSQTKAHRLSCFLLLVLLLVLPLLLSPSFKHGLCAVGCCRQQAQVGAHHTHIPQAPVEASAVAAAKKGQCRAADWATS